MPSSPSMSCSGAECRYRRTPQMICRGWRTWDGNRCRSHWLKTEKQGRWNKACTDRSSKKINIKCNQPQNLENTVKEKNPSSSSKGCQKIILKSQIWSTVLKIMKHCIELVCRRPAARTRGSNYLFARIFSQWVFCLWQVLLSRLRQKDTGKEHNSPHQNNSLPHC